MFAGVNEEGRGYDAVRRGTRNLVGNETRAGEVVRNWTIGRYEER